MSEMPAEVEWGGCPWPVDPACLTDEWNELDPDAQERALMLASSALEGLVAYRVSNCSITVRPCAKSCCAPTSLSPFRPGDWMNPHINANGAWVNGCGCQGSCACSTACEVVLPGPVGRVDQIKVDGIPMNLADFRLDNGNILVYQGNGPCPFNLQQDLSKPDSAPGTFSITYLNAYAPDRQAAIAVTALALEFAKACKPKGKCALPRGVTNVVRNGLSFTVEAGLFPNGETNIEVVDAFIRRWNPNHLTQQPRLIIPGQKRLRTSRSL